VQDYFILLDRAGALARSHEALYVAAREAAGSEVSPSAAIIDSQSARGAQKRGYALDRQGYDVGKKVTGRSRHVLVDTLGLLLSVIPTMCRIVTARDRFFCKRASAFHSSRQFSRMAAIRGRKSRAPWRRPDHGA
jgi:hypothetical protein